MADNELFQVQLEYLLYTLSTAAQHHFESEKSSCNWYNDMTCGTREHINFVTDHRTLNKNQLNDTPTACPGS